MSLQSLILLIVLPASVLGAEQRHQFTQPIRLEYGDPLTVAPMMGPSLTVDWDRDGTLDLVGGGRWWRDTGVRRDGLPVFESAGTTSISPEMIGDLNGNAFADVVGSTRTGYAWFEDTGLKGPRQFVQRGTLTWAMGGNVPPPELGEGTPACWLADFDGDGRTDLLAGSRSVGLERYLPKTGPGFGVGYKDGTWLFRDMTGTVWFHRNVGTKDEPLFGAGRMITTGTAGRAITFFDKADPRVVDWDGDGKQDLLVVAFDRAVVFLNVGDAQGMPHLDDGHLITFDGQPTLPYERRRVFPFRDQAGLWHLRLGGPTASETIQLAKDDPFDFGPVKMIPFRNPDLCLDTFAVPDAVDWDGDGKIDLIVGCEDGWIWFFKNQDPAGGIARWAPPVQVEADGKPIRLDKQPCLQGPCEWLWGYSNPTVADWDVDGDFDLVCGSTAETYVWFENVGDAKHPKLAARGPLLCGEGTPVSCVWRTRPGIGDLDGDGLPDLVGVAGNRQLCWWRRSRGPDGQLRLAPATFPTGPDGRTFTVTGAVRATGRTKLVVCDWNHDGHADLIASPPLGQRTYQLLFLNRGVGGNQLRLELQSKTISMPLDLKGWSHFAMCEPVDFDNDGQWEVLSGLDRGYIYYWKE